MKLFIKSCQCWTKEKYVLLWLYYPVVIALLGPGVVFQLFFFFFLQRMVGFEFYNYIDHWLER